MINNTYVCIINNKIYININNVTRSLKEPVVSLQRRR